METQLVTEYIKENILHSKLYDSADDTTKRKAVNQSVNMLFKLLGVFKRKEDIPVSDVAEQALWLLKMDDTMQRVEMGATSISVDGISISFSEMDRSIAPSVLSGYGMHTTKRSRVGSYSVPLEDTWRIGQQPEPSDYPKGLVR